MNEFLVLLQAKLDEAKSKGLINSDIASLQSRLDKLKLQVELDPNTAQKLANDIGKLINQQITISNINIDANQTVKNAQQTGQQIGRQIQSGINSVIQKGNFKTEFTFSADKQNNVAKVAQEEFKKISNGIITVKEQMSQVDGKSFLDGFVVNIKKANGEVESLTYRLKDMLDAQGKVTGKSFQYVSGSINDNGVIKQLDAILTKADNLQIKLDKLKAGYSDINASRPIKDSNNISELSQQYDKVSQAIENVRSADNATFSSMVSNAQREITVLESMVAQFRNAENVATQMKSVDISSGITQAQERLGKLKADSTGFEQMTQTLRELDTAITNVGDKSSLDAFIDKLRVAETQLSRVKAEAKQLSQIHEIQLSIGENGDITAKVNVIRDAFTKLGLSADEVNLKVNNVDNEIKELKSLLDSGTNDLIIVTQFNKLQSTLRETQNDLKTTRSEYSLLVSAQQRLNKANTIEAWKQKNTAITKQAQADTQAYINTLRNLNVQMTKMEFEQISRGFKETEISMRGLNKLGASLKDQFSQAAQSFTQWLSVSSGIMALVYQLQKMPKEVIAVNSAMVELNKVSDASDSDIAKYFDEAAKSAKRYGSSVSDLISATADWSRLGYSLPDSKKLAEVATLYKNVGDGIDIATANESLVSTLQGFKLEANDAMHIIDAFNEVGNNFAIGSDGIGEALKRSASSMYAAGNTLEETIGLVTAANAVVQDPDSIGTAYKTISMRIRGAKTEMEELGLETEGMVESTATLQKEILALSGVDIMKDKDTFKSTYQILDELAVKWQDLTDIQQASITELIAGKRQGNIVSALMSNFETARQATETAINSTGSALKEQEAYEQGIQYSLDRLEASFQTFANHILDSDFLKGIIDFGNGTINVIDNVVNKLGSLGTIGLGAGMFSSIKNVGMA